MIPTLRLTERWLRADREVVGGWLLSRVAYFRQAGQVNGVTQSLLFCRCLEIKFEHVASPGVCVARGRVGKAIPQLLQLQSRFGDTGNV